MVPTRTQASADDPWRDAEPIRQPVEF